MFELTCQSKPSEHYQSNWIIGSLSGVYLVFQLCPRTENTRNTTVQRTAAHWHTVHFSLDFSNFLLFACISEGDSRAWNMALLSDKVKYCISFAFTVIFIVCVILEWGRSQVTVPILCLIFLKMISFEKVTVEPSQKYPRPKVPGLWPP